MKDSRFHKALKDISDVRLTDAEKRSMVGRIVGVSPVSSRSVASPWSLYSFGNLIMQHRFASVLAVVLVVIIGGGGLINASQSALPGDTLYAMKVNVAEPLQLALTVDPVAKAETKADLLQKRLEEVETLAATDRLDGTSKDMAYTRIEKQVADIRAHNEDVERVSSDKADDVNTTVEASIIAHQKVLASISHKLAPRSIAPRMAQPVAARSMAVQDHSAADSNIETPTATEETDSVSTLMTMSSDSNNEAVGPSDAGSNDVAGFNVRTDSASEKTSKRAAFVRKVVSDEKNASTSQDRAERFKKIVQEKEQEYLKKAAERLKKDSKYSEIRKHD